jgi:hypothetical protein
MDGIPTSYSAGVYGAASVQQALQQQRASRLLTQRLGAMGAGSTDQTSGTPVEPPDRALSIAPPFTGQSQRLDVRA